MRNGRRLAQPADRSRLLPNRVIRSQIEMLIDDNVVPKQRDAVTGERRRQTRKTIADRIGFYFDP